MIPVIIEDANRHEYLDALKAYQDGNGISRLTELFRKEQNFYFEKCRYFIA